MTPTPVEHFEVLQETIKILQEQRNNSLDRLVGAETNNRLMTKRIAQYKEHIENLAAEKDARILSITEDGRIALLESKSENAKLQSVVQSLTTRNAELDSITQELRSKIQKIQQTHIRHKT